MQINTTTYKHLLLTNPKLTPIVEGRIVSPNFGSQIFYMDGEERTIMDNEQLIHNVSDWFYKGKIQPSFRPTKIQIPVSNKGDYCVLFTTGHESEIDKLILEVQYITYH